MKAIAAALLVTLASCSAVAPAQQNVGVGRDNRVSIYLGQRSLDEDDWEPIDDQAMLGFEYVREQSGAPIGFEIGLMFSGDEDDILGTDIEGATAEIYGGVRKTFGSDVVRPYIGGGLSLVSARVDIEGLGDDDDTTFGGYLHGGVGFQVSDLIVLGLDLRFLFGSDFDIGGLDVGSEYMQAALFLGFAF
jgi:opacity protein-like surface antigen